VQRVAVGGGCKRLLEASWNFFNGHEDDSLTAKSRGKFDFNSCWLASCQSAYPPPHIVQTRRCLGPADTAIRGILGCFLVRTAVILLFIYQAEILRRSDQ
jgi:hypothetical protein